MSTMNSQSARPRAKNETAFEARLAPGIRGEAARRAVRCPGFVAEKIPDRPHRIDLTRSPGHPNGRYLRKAVMSGRRPVVKGYFEAAVNVSGAVMSTAY